MEGLWPSTDAYQKHIKERTQTFAVVDSVCGKRRHDGTHHPSLSQPTHYTATLYHDPLFPFHYLLSSLSFSSLHLLSYLFIYFFLPSSSPATKPPQKNPDRRSAILCGLVVIEANLAACDFGEAAWPIAP